jgi:probable F420-dependent oxidoreductase
MQSHAPPIRGRLPKFGDSQHGQSTSHDRYMKFGIAFANTAWYTSTAGAIDMAKSAEGVGVDSLWTVEHVVVPVGYESPYPYSPTGKMPGNREDFDVPDPLIWMSFVAAHTTTIKLGTGILILPQRNALVVAKEVATLDAMSGGRVLLGVGVGWLREEFEALGASFSDRGKRLDEQIEVLRAVWTGSPAEFHGTYTQFGPLYSRPAPARGTVPLVIGGHSEAAARRAGRLGDGFFPGAGSIEELTHLLAIVRSTADEHGRDPDAIEITTGAIVSSSKLHDHVEALAKIGVHRITVAPPKPGDFATIEGLVDRFS